MPPRNVAAPNAVRLFNCAICDKGYPRQVDYENHLRSYDHNHRQRLAEMKKLTAANDTEGSRPKAGGDMRSISLEEANKKPGVGSRFTKIGGGAAGGRFKKVGVAVGGTIKNNDDANKKADEQVQDTLHARAKSIDPEMPPLEDISKIPAPATAVEKQSELEKAEDADTDGEESEEEDITWEEYDFLKPTGCDHANCPGCQVDVKKIWSGKWIED